LRTYADTQATYLGKPIWQRMKSAIETDFMPPAGPLSPADRSVMLRWLDAGARAAAPGEACP
jgi:hypothetical protein